MDRQARKLANRHNQGDRQVGCLYIVTGIAYISYGRTVITVVNASYPYIPISALTERTE